MEFLFGNLAFSLLIRGGSIAIALGLLLWAGLWAYRNFGSSKAQEYYLLIKRGCAFLWVFVVGWSIFVIAQSNSPRLVVEDHGKTRPEYAVEAAPIQNFNPNTKTDEERVQDNRELQRENAINAE
ncbi:MAG: hypothetical protein OXF23_01145 [Candidatus Dadabacteria bacterium]|nr:hypothetical protein [Candidatus Dadabacteria bacterium]